MWRVSTLSIIALIAVILIIYFIRKLIKHEWGIFFSLFAMAMTILSAWSITYPLVEDEYVRARVTANRKYSIGYVIRYTISVGSKISSRSAKMYLDLNGQKKVVRSSIILNNKYESGEIDGRHFLVAYDSLDTEYCVRLFDYPISDSSDYRRYMQELKKTPINLINSPWLSNLLYKKED